MNLKRKNIMVTGRVGLGVGSGIYKALFEYDARLFINERHGGKINTDEMEMKSNVEQFMKECKRNKKLVRKYFHEEYVQYTA